MRLYKIMGTHVIRCAILIWLNERSRVFLDVDKHRSREARTRKLVEKHGNTHVRYTRILHQARFVSCNVLPYCSPANFVKRPKLIKAKSKRADIKKYQPQGFRRNRSAVNVIKLHIHPILPITRITYGT